MYSRQKDDSQINVPPNYSGNTFRPRRANVHITPERGAAPPRQRTDRREAMQPPSARSPIFEVKDVTDVTDTSEAVNEEQSEVAAEWSESVPKWQQNASKKSENAHNRDESGAEWNKGDANAEKKDGALSAPSLLSPLGSLGSEELLLIALALIIFQSGKDPDLALILLALLFI